MGGADVIRISEGRALAAEHCRAGNPDGRKCRNRADETGFCRKHRLDAPEPGTLEATAQQLLGFLRRRLTGEYHVDDFGFDKELTEVVYLPLLRPLFKRYWRVDQVGTHNIPTAGSALIVANHSGTVPVDALMMKLGVFDAVHRHVRLLAADLAVSMPVVGEISRKGGSTLACEEDATRLLHAGELVGVFPEGFKGVGKSFSERYRLQRFGRGGSVEVAIQTGAPIVPVAIVGAEEIYPMIGNIKPLARLLGFPYFPVTPTFPLLGLLGTIPLPSKWIIEYGDPIDTTALGPEAANDPMLMFNLGDEIRDRLQQMLYRNLISRRHAFF